MCRVCDVAVIPSAAGASLRSSAVLRPTLPPLQFPESPYLHILYSSFLIEARKQYQVGMRGF